MMQGTSSCSIDLLVVGLPKSGKSSFLRTISQRLESTHGWISGHMIANHGLEVNLIEPPLPNNLEFAWLKEIIDQSQVNGFIVMCDSTQPDSFMEVIYLLQTIRAYHPRIPCVLVANYQEHPLAWSTAQIRTRLGIGSDILVMPCANQDPDTAEAIIHEIVRQILST